MERVRPPQLERAARLGARICIRLGSDPASSHQTWAYEVLTRGALEEAGVGEVLVARITDAHHLVERSIVRSKLGFDVFALGDAVDRALDQYEAEQRQ